MDSETEREREAEVEDKEEGSDHQQNHSLYPKNTVLRGLSIRECHCACILRGLGHRCSLPHCVTCIEREATEYFLC